jgi:hypothetical protein
MVNEEQASAHRSCQRRRKHRFGGAAGKTTAYQSGGCGSSPRAVGFFSNFSKAFYFLFKSLDFISLTIFFILQFFCIIIDQ